MKNIFYKYIASGLLIWAIPFIISLFLYDSQLKSWRHGYITDKIVLVFILLVITLITFLVIRYKNGSNWIITPLLTLILSALLDITILINILKSFDIYFWIFTILPPYILIYFGLSYTILKDSAPKTKETVK